MTLTYDKTDNSILIARLKNGKLNNQRIYIDLSEKANPIDSNDPIDFINDEWLKKQKKNMKTTELIRLQHAILKKKVPDDPELEKIYEKAINYLHSKQRSEIIYNDGSRISPIYLLKNDPKEPTVRVYCCGATGSGKTTWIINFIKELLHSKATFFNKAIPKRIIVFSVLEEDAKLDELDVTRIKIDDQLLDDPIKLDELDNSIVIFDDVETFSNKKYRDAVANLRDQCLSEGRHHGIITLCTNHQITDYKKTRNLLLESELITFFPKGGGLSGIKRLLTTYVGLGKDEIEKILSLPSRWITIYNRYPITCLYETGMFLLTKVPEKKAIEEPKKEEEAESSESEEEAIYEIAGR